MMSDIGNNNNNNSDISPSSSSSPISTPQLSQSEKLKLNHVFHNYKPICDQLITILSNTDENKFEKKDNKQIIEQIKSLIQQLIDITTEKYANDNWSLNYIFDYLMIPLSLLINPTNLSKQNQKVLFCIKKQSVQLQSFNLLLQLLKRVKINQFNKFINILTVLLNFLNNNNNNNNINNNNNSNNNNNNDSNNGNLEEFYLVILENIKELYNSAEESFFNKELYKKHPFTVGDQFVPYGYTISTLLGLLQNEKNQESLNSNKNNLSRDIKKLIVLTLNNIIKPFLSRNLEYYNILFQIFPATISSLFKVISGDFKLGSTLKVQCLDLFSDLISNTMSDKVRESLKNDSERDTFKLSESNLFNLFCLLYPTSNSYSKLRPQHSLFSKSSQSILTSKISLDKYKNKEALIKSAYQILSNCKCLVSLAPILLEVLVLHYNDDYPQIVDQTKKYLYSLLDNNSTTSNQNPDISILLKYQKNKQHQKESIEYADIKFILQDNFNHLFKSLGMLICSHSMTNDSIPTRDDITSLLFSSRMEITATTLLSLVEMKSPPPKQPSFETNKNLSQSLEDSLRIVSENPFENKKKSLLISFSNLSKPFLHFYSENIERDVIRLIQLIGKYSDIKEWIDIFLSNSLLSTSPKRKEILFCLNHLLIGNSNPKEVQSDTDGAKANKIYSSLDFSTTQYILDEILSPSLINLTISREQDQLMNRQIKSQQQPTQQSESLISISSKDTLLEEYYDNTITISLVIDNIGTLTTLLPKSPTKYRQIFLSKVIYQLLEKYGLSSVDSTKMILKSSRIALENIMNCFEYYSIEDIIYRNSDYLLDTIESHMKYLDSFPNTPNIFEGILNITGLGFLPFLSDTVRMILGALDLAIENSKNIQIFISILYSIVKVLYNNSKHELLYQQVLKKIKQDKKSKQEIEKDQQVLDQVKENRSIDEIKQFFINHHSLRDEEKTEELYKDIDTKNNSKSKEDIKITNITPESLNIPKYKETTEVQRLLVQDIVQKCIHFMGSKNKAIKMTTIDIVEMGLVIVATGSKNYGGNDDEQEEIVNTDGSEPIFDSNINPIKTNNDKHVEKVALFPLIHKVWGSLVRRVEEGDRVVCKKSLKVIQTISNLAEEFISQRFWDHLWPIIRRILVEEQTIHYQENNHFKSYKASTSSSSSSSSSVIQSKINEYSTTSKKPLIQDITNEKSPLEQKQDKAKKDKLKYTPSFKLQYVCLETLKTILSTIGRMYQSQVFEIARNTLYYLNRNQPDLFQQFTIEIWSDILLKQDPDSLWLLLFNLSNQFNNPDFFKNPNHDDCLVPIPSFKYTSKDLIDFKANALLLFNLLN
ncbi:hypothetical protein DICPUDRAFT_156651 [Dictyostelium purpureum]|uniref:Uncharacterized protein n=1 Tax=Dictyostelium purpureum TaxID=5786 RepID=F0ZX25_DICPU|nr:uncharacterized protein DICPUDRAFT_156651 [Dictyostelium purpureum]EGC31494.1 hypothetical protein DICPUDRAFT_156651 [Dictyostelium purpureum]|eukprot:XP_003291969.1 hypothetical protein DICPUDRAFT_156651 [Dictyostelium purpureum]